MQKELKVVVRVATRSGGQHTVILDPSLASATSRDEATKLFLAEAREYGWERGDGRGATPYLVEVVVDGDQQVYVPTDFDKYEEPLTTEYAPY
jgi:phosphoribosyl-AMP cyclohydrolase